MQILAQVKVIIRLHNAAVGMTWNNATGMCLFTNNL